jgi:hypothetical protein
VVEVSGNAFRSASQASIPIVPQFDAEPSRQALSKAAQMASRLLAEEPALNDTDFFGPRVSSGLSGAPALLFEDHSEISLFNAREDSPLEYRALLLAGKDDIVLIGGQQFPGFEKYCQDRLGLGQALIATPAPVACDRNVSISERCIADAAVMERICAHARRHRGLNIVPYIGTGSAWRLANIVASQSASDVLVAAPPPRLTRRVNDKLWFAERVQELLDRDALPVSHSVFGPAALSGRVAALGSRFDRVVVKVPDSSGSLGNVVLSSADIARWSLSDLRKRILDVLEERGWRGTYPLMVGVWDYPVIASPSVNIWIPKAGDGLPIIESVFTQILSGPAGEFIGATPSDLPDLWQHRIVREAMAIASLFQLLGYFGRCGLDAILIGESCDDAALHWIECNGRWGGVSTPITLANRLVGDWHEKAVLIVQQTQLAMPPRSFDDFLALLGDRLFDARTSKQGVVILAPGRIVDGSGLNMMVLAETPEAAQATATSITTLLAE